LTGGQAGYWTLYNYTALALKSVDKRLRVGGPATAQSQWISEFLQFTKQAGLPVDFVSTHEYPTDIDPVQNGILKKVINNTRNIVGPNMDLFYSEYNDGLFYDPAYHDTPYASSFIIKNIYDILGLADILSWWTFTDIFEEPGFLSIPFGANTQWGLLNIYEIPKPSYHAFRLLHLSGTDLVQTTPSVDAHPTVGAYAVRGMGELMVFVFNHNVPLAPIETQTVCLTIKNWIPSKNPQPMVYRIDDNHSNVYQAWQQMGSPMYPNTATIDALNKVAAMRAEDIPYEKMASDYLFQVVVPPQGVAVIVL